MSNQAQKPVITNLDPLLLKTPFKHTTRWQVIAGAICSGKTTLIDLLSARGFRVVPEVGRGYVEREIARGRTLEEIRADPIAFDHMCHRQTLKVERELPQQELVFLDRALPDCLAFARLHGLDPNEFLPECFHFHYGGVFVLDRFPVKRDTARIEDEATAIFLDEWIERDYRTLGYDVIRVPVLPPVERVEFILNKQR